MKHLLAWPILLVLCVLVAAESVQARKVVSMPTVETIDEALARMDAFEGKAEDFRVAIPQRLFDAAGVNAATITDHALRRGWASDGFAEVLTFRVYRFNSRDSSASLLLPDAEFSFSAPVLDAKEATDAIATALLPLGFKITQRPVARKNDFFRAEFERAPGTTVSLSGRVACVHVGIYTSISRQPQTAEEIESEAAELYNQLLTSLRDAGEGILLFKSSGNTGACEEAL
jgi:hypothetical protein